MPDGRFLIQRRDRNVDDISIESEGLTIGRLPGNELVVNHRAVDETHAGISNIAGRYWIFNLSSGNGIVVNRSLVERVEIRNGDILQIGPFLFHFGLGAGELRITVEVGAGWQIEETGSEASRKNMDEDPDDVPDAPSLEVFWEKRKRESGKIADHTILHPRAARRLGKALACWRPTLDLRRPWRNALVLWTSLGVAFFGLTALAAWRDVYSPGELSSAHRAPELSGHRIAKRPAAGSCGACHSPMQSMESRCLECHLVSGFARALSDPHRTAGIECSTCHKEHVGGNPLDGLTNYAVCIECHTDKGPVHQGSRAGEILGLPHPATHGYPVVAGTWRWKGLSAAEWNSRGLPQYLAQRPPDEQFHAVHRTIRMPSALQTNRMQCNACHGPGTPGKEPHPLALAKACTACHVSSGDEAASSSGCVSCHPQHGSTHETKTIFAALRGDFRNMRRGVEAHRARTLRARLRTVLREDARVGALSLRGWAAMLCCAGLLSPLMLLLQSLRLRSSLAAKPALPPVRAGDPSKGAGPAYPHPEIDPLLCIGCHACVNACPHDVIAIVNGIATPVALDQCMDDTSCMAECPTSPKACVVVNTTKKVPPRKVPRRNQLYMSDVSGVYIVGDVSGVPLVKNALNEGAQVIQHVVEDLRQEPPVAGIEYDAAILGVGAAGFSAAVCARDAGLKYVAIEQGRLANTLRTYPAGKYVFFKPDTVPVKGPVPLPGVGGKKEELLRSWTELAADVEIHEMERCTGIAAVPGGFRIRTQGEAGQGQNVYTARRVILAIGNAGSPMKLGAPGEELKVPRGAEGSPVPRVKYNLSDPDDYKGCKCVVVGAGNSAIEAAVDLCGFVRHGGDFSFTRNNQVILVVRSDFKGDLKLGNKMNIFDCMDAGRIKVFFRATIKEVREREVVLADARSGEEKACLENDFIFALIGSERPTKFLQSLGIHIEGAEHKPGR